MTEETRTLIDAAVEHLPKASIHFPHGEVAPHLVAISDPANIQTRLESLEPYFPAPVRVRKRVEFETPKSFADYVQEFTIHGATRIFASLDARRIVGKLDYHEPKDGEPADPSWCDHDAIYQTQFDDAFEAWMGLHGKLIGQQEFAEFLEDHAQDAVIPDPADLMELAENFQALRNVVFESKVGLTGQSRQFTYREDDTIRGTTNFPKLIKFRTPVFYGCEAVEWVARFYYAIRDGKLFFKVTIHRLQELLDREFEHLLDGIRVELAGLPVHRAKV